MELSWIQTGEARCGNAIIDCVIVGSANLADGAQRIIVVFDWTMRSVGMVMGVICYERDRLDIRMRRRFEEGGSHSTVVAPQLVQGHAMAVRGTPRPRQVSAPSRRSASRGVRDVVMVTCEHGGNKIPVEYAGLFRGWHVVLRTHRGFDAGALEMARDLAAALHAPLVASTVSRLLVDLNRSLSNRHAWSDVTRGLPPLERERLVRRHYAPYRYRVAALVAEGVAAGHRVVHFSSHSFSPVLEGEVRTADVGLLYDPARSGEVALATGWKSAFAEQAPELRVRRNYPYGGRNDGLTSFLRRRFSPAHYVGIEIELNQALVSAGAWPWRHLRQTVITTLQAALR